MYTQCPECSVAFRVTADVLKQAAGKVRCGSCGIAFNALEHLSETKPAAPVRRDSDSQLPELSSDEPAELEADTPPESISAEQSAALLKTLDELAGSDIRIEDTGIEWRVLDDDGDEADAEEEEPELIADTGSLQFIITDEKPKDAEAKSAIEDMRFDDNTPLPEDFDLDAPPSAPESAPVSQAEPADHSEDVAVDLGLSDADEWQDLLGEMAASGADAEAQAAIADDAADDSLEDVVSLSESAGEAADETAAEDPPDVDTQFALQALELGIDTSGKHEAVANDDVGEDRDPSIDDDLIAAAFENEAAAKAEADARGDEEAVAGDVPARVDAVEHEEPVEIDEPDEIDELDEIEIELEFDDDEDDEGDAPDTAYSDASLVEELDDLAEIELDDDVVDEITEEKPEFIIPEMTEEEKTINMLIDQELLSVAVEDEDGFASTIVQVQPDKKVEKEIEANETVDVSLKPAAEDEPPAKPQLFETIVMEGEFVRAEQDAERNEKNRRLGNAMKAKREAEQSDKRKSTNRPSIGMVAGIVGLGLLLVLQVLHQSREALATVPAFNDAIAPVYRMLGKPITPAWDVTGWTVEATTGSTDENEEMLTVYARVANRSDDALPYPLVHVSLTDRYEEIIGSRVLEPAQYLASDLDPRDAVAAGNTFNAVIAIEAPAPDATGYKISVCYRLASGQLRCAIDDFR